LEAYPVCLPPKVFFYEPKISGFAIVGKRGSKFFKPEPSGVKSVYDDEGKTETEKLVEDFKK
jgi:hypothetical protein